MGQCQYRYNPTELYQRTKPGMGPETICGAPTYPAVDEPEMVMCVEHSGGPLVYKATGRMMPRGQHDPYCAEHGGTPEPPLPPVTIAELEAAYQQYAELAGRFTEAVPVAVPDPLQIASARSPATGYDTAYPRETNSDMRSDNGQ